MRKVLSAFAIILVCVSVQAQELGAFNKILDKLGNEASTGKQYDDFVLEGKKFVAVRDSADHSEKIVVEFHPQNKITVIELITDKKTKEDFSNVFTGDVMRNHNAISVRADMLEGKKLGNPIVYNFYLAYHKGIYYLININNQEKWIETNYLDKKLPRKDRKK